MVQELIPLPPAPPVHSKNNPIWIIPSTPLTLPQFHHAQDIPTPPDAINNPPNILPLNVLCEFSMLHTLG